MSTNSNSSPTFADLTRSITSYVRLLIEDTRLSATEKLIRACSGIALCSLLLILGTVALVFISISVSLLLSTVMAPLWAFVIVAGFYILLAVLLLLFRTPLVVNPIARFISRLLLPAPQKPASDDKPSTLS